MNNPDERRLILDMLSQDKISVDEAMRLLEALEEEEGTDFKKELDSFLELLRETATKLGQKGQEVLQRIEKNIKSGQSAQSSVHQSRIEILRMLDEEKITVQEAQDLLERLGK